MWDECNCAVVWAFFGIAFLWDWNENWAFPVLWPLLSFPDLLAYWVQHFHSIIFQDLEPVCCSMSSSNCCFLTCIQISQEAGQVVWYSHLFQNFPQFIVIHIVKGFGIVNKAEIDVFLELSYFFHDPADVGNLISGSSAFSKTSLNIRQFTVHILLKPSLENFEHHFTSVWDACNCAIVWTFFGIAFLWYWNENWRFSVLWPLLSFPILLTYWVQHIHSIIFLGFEIAQLEFHHLH